jgi:hypothetical protein
VAEGSTGFPTTAGAFQTVGSGASDAVAYKLSNGNGPSLTLAVIPSAPLPHQLVQMTATVPGAGSAGSVNFTWYDSGANRTSSAPLINGVASLTTSFSEGISLLGATYRSGNSNVADSPPLLLQIAPSGVCN